MKLATKAAHVLVRLRYPVSLPEEIASALGIDICNSLRFKKILNLLTSPGCCPTTLARFMPRDVAERAFTGALRKDCFSKSSLFSFYFPDGWMEFELQFDEISRLRRIYVHHKLISHHHGFELPLKDHFE